MTEGLIQRKTHAERPCFAFLVSIALSLFSLVSTADEASSSSFENHPILIGGVKFPPLTYINDTGTIVGPGVDKLNELFDMLELPYEWLGVAQNRLYREIQSGTVDYAIVTKKRSEMDVPLLFAKRPFTCLAVTLFNSRDQMVFKDYQDLEDRTLLYYYYFENVDLFKTLEAVPGIKLQSVDNRESAVHMINAKRADYYLDFELPVMRASRQTDITLGHKRIYQEGAYIASPKANPKSKALITMIDLLMEKSAFYMDMPGSKSEPVPACS